MVSAPLALALAVAVAVVAELPVHCSLEQVVGEWVFRLSAPAAQRSACGHRRPDDPRAEPRDFRGAEKWSVLLDQDHALSEWEVGEWSMAADAGFVVRLRGRRFVALSDFE